MEMKRATPDEAAPDAAVDATAPPAEAKGEAELDNNTIGSTEAEKGARKAKKARAAEEETVVRIKNKSDKWVDAHATFVQGGVHQTVVQC